MILSFAFISAAVASAMALLLASSNKKWHDETEADMTALCDDVGRTSSSSSKTENGNKTTSLQGLPHPIQRYLQKALGVASLNEPIRRIKMLSIQQRGRFLLNGKWIDFTARQIFSASSANRGFVWEANMRLPVLSLFGRSLTVPINVRDAYVNGSGTMVGKLLGALTIVDVRDTPELNEGELSRWLGESIVFPTALIPADGELVQKLQWKESDDAYTCTGTCNCDKDEGTWNEQTATATAVLVGASCKTFDGKEQEVKTEIEFRCSKETGLVNSIYAMRPYAEPGQQDVKMLPWEVSIATVSFVKAVHLPSLLYTYEVLISFEIVNACITGAL